MTANGILKIEMDSKACRKQMGAELERLRLSKQITKYRAAKDGGIQIRQVSAVESGDTNYTIDLLLAYCKGCGLSIGFLQG